MRPRFCSSVLVSLVLIAVASCELRAQDAKSQSQAITPSSAAPSLVSHVMPVYPQIAQSARVEGLVQLGVAINAEGRVVQVRVLRSVPLLDQAAIDAVRQWRFEPPSDKSTAVTATVTFRLNDPFRYPRPATYRRPLSSWIPKNFAFVYKYDCRRTTVEIDSIARLVTNTQGRPPTTRQVAFGFEGEQAADVYVALVGAGFFDPSRRNAGNTWREAARAEPGIQQAGDQITVSVAAEPPVVDIQTTVNRQIHWGGAYGELHRRPSFLHTLKVRRDDLWTQFEWTEPLTAHPAERDEALSAVGQQIRALVRTYLTDPKMRPDCL